MPCGYEVVVPLPHHTSCASPSADSAADLARLARPDEMRVLGILTKWTTMKPTRHCFSAWEEALAKWRIEDRSSGDFLPGLSPSSKVSKRDPSNLFFFFQFLVVAM